MAREPAPKVFRPERPIYLNEENTGFKTRDQVIVAIEELRDLNWLCAYNENTRPLHMSFNNVKEFAEFKKDCSKLSIKLKEPVIKELEDIEKPIIEPESNTSYEDPSGKIHIE